MDGQCCKDVGFSVNISGRLVNGRRNGCKFVVGVICGRADGSNGRLLVIRVVVDVSIYKRVVQWTFVGVKRNLASVVMSTALVSLQCIRSIIVVIDINGEIESIKSLVPRLSYLGRDFIA